MTDYLTKLKEIAEKATPGPYYVQDAEPGYASVFAVDKTGDELVCRQAFSSDAHHIATFNPSTVLILLDVIERQREALEWYASVERPADEYSSDCGERARRCKGETNTILAGLAEKGEK